jgi:ketosteroid isomerase-like protein
LLQLLDEQIEWVTPGPPGLATSGKRTGRQAVGEFFGVLNEVFEVQRFQPKEFMAQGDRVIVLGDETSSVRATGKVLDMDWVHVFTVRGGTIVAFQEFFDTAAVVAALAPAHAAA